MAVSENEDRGMSNPEHAAAPPDPPPHESRQADLLKRARGATEAFVSDAANLRPGDVDGDPDAGDLDGDGRDDRAALLDAARDELE